MRLEQSSHALEGVQLSAGLAELKGILEEVDISELLTRLAEYRRRGGPKGHPQEALWRCYVASFVLNIENTSDLRRRLEDDEGLRQVCGFTDSIPHRTTICRFIRRLGDHLDVVENCFAEITTWMALRLPGFGHGVAIDSTTVRSHSNPDRSTISDPEASWTAKSRPKSKNKRDWYWGYKLHTMTDAVHGLPIASFTTTASRNDSGTLPELLDKADSTYTWFRPEYVIADKGYDAMSNYLDVLRRKAIPIIPLRALPKGRLREGIYDSGTGSPTCLGMHPMEHIRSDPDRGDLFQCRPEGCHLRERKGVRYCHERVWEDRNDNPRVFPSIRRGSERWKRIYRLRQSVERFFKSVKSVKQSRRLEAHCIRGLKAVSLHTAMATLVFQATAAYRIASGQRQYLRWQVRKVA